MTIREFVRTVWASKYYVVAAVLAVVAGAIVYLAGTTTTYEAMAEVTLQTGSIASVEGEDAGTVVTVNTAAALVREPEVIAAAAQALGNGETEESLAPTITSNYNAENRVMYVTAHAEDADAAVARANAAATAYSDSLVTVRQNEIAAYDERLAELNGQLQATYNTTNGNDPNSPVAAANRNAIEDQITNTSNLRVALTAIDPPGVVTLPATGASALGLAPIFVLAIAALAGFVVGVGLAFARRGLDTRVGDSLEASSVAESPVLAELYSVRSAEKDYSRSGVLPVSRRSASPFTESIRELRTAMQVPLGEGGYAVVAVTAADPHAPRSFITANLAASFALSGRPTVVVPGDLRQPQLAGILPPPPGWHGPTDALRPTRIPNLSLLPVDAKELDPADFLATAAVREMIEAQRANATVVVIDSPPVLAAADATILGGYAQGVVLVASAGKPNRAVLQEAAERLRTNNVPLSGIALTGIEGDRRMLYASTYGQGGEASVVTRETAVQPAPTPVTPSAAEGVLSSADMDAGGTRGRPGGPVTSDPVPAAAVTSGPEPAAAVTSDPEPAAAVTSGPEPAAAVASGPEPATGYGEASPVPYHPSAGVKRIAVPATPPAGVLGDPSGISDPEDTQTRTRPIPVVEPATGFGSQPVGSWEPASASTPIPRIQRPIRPPAAGPARRR